MKIPLNKLGYSATLKTTWKISFNRPHCHHCTLETIVSQYYQKGKINQDNIKTETFQRNATVFIFYFKEDYKERGIDSFLTATLSRSPL